jgi:hypothetical protein
MAAEGASPTRQSSRERVQTSRARDMTKSRSTLESVEKNDTIEVIETKMFLCQVACSI